MTNEDPASPEEQDQLDASDVGQADQASNQTRQLRVLEALLFAAEQPLGADDVKQFFDEDTQIEGLFLALRDAYAGKGINLVQRGDNWAFRTAEDLAHILRRENTVSRQLSRAALETLAIIAYHQPVTRAEIEEVRGVQAGKGTLDALMAAGWIKMRGRRRTPGRPVTYGTTPEFLDQFSLATLGDLPGLEELKGSGLLSAQLPDDLQIPMMFDASAEREEEDPLDESEEEQDAEFAASELNEQVASPPVAKD